MGHRAQTTLYNVQPSRHCVVIYLILCSYRAHDLERQPSDCANLIPLLSSEALPSTLNVPRAKNIVVYYYASGSIAREYGRSPEMETSRVPTLEISLALKKRKGEIEKYKKSQRLFRRTSSLQPTTKSSRGLPDFLFSHLFIHFSFPLRSESVLLGSSVR
jgi:hypothetical protein